MRTEKERTRILPPAGVYTATWIPYGYRYDPDSIALVKIVNFCPRSPLARENKSTVSEFQVHRHGGEVHPLFFW